MMFFITGASGSGKTTCLRSLTGLRTDLRWYDFDDGGVPPGADKAWRQRRTEHWLRVGLAHQADGLDTAICGNAIPGEVLACPSAPQIRGTAFCLLDCYDVDRIDRLRARGLHGDTMEMLCWAAWQRVHAVDPQWRPDVIREGGAEEMRWARWDGWRRGDPRWPSVWRLDTTGLGVGDAVARISAWIDDVRFEETARGPDGVT